MGFCSGTFKFFMFLINFIFFLAGVGIIALGAYMAIEMKDYFDFLGASDLVGDKDLKVSAYIFIVVGVFVTMIAFFGCCAACTDNKCMMGTFAVLMALILIAEIGVAVTIIIYKGKAYAIVADAMKNGLNGYKQEGKEGVTVGWDKIQEQFVCCGVEGPTDWTKSKAFNNTLDAPDSCCTGVETDTCGKGKNTKPFTGLHTEGCLEKFQAFVEGNVYLVGGVGIAVALVQLLAVITGCCLAKKMGLKDDMVF
jgi:CD63 antigen